MAENQKVLAVIVSKAKRKYRIQNNLKGMDEAWATLTIKTESVQVPNAIGKFEFVIFDRQSILNSIERATQDWEEIKFLCAEYADLKQLHEKAKEWHDKLKLLLVTLP